MKNLFLPPHTLSIMSESYNNVAMSEGFACMGIHETIALREKGHG